MDFQAASAPSLSPATRLPGLLLSLLALLPLGRCGAPA